MLTKGIITDHKTERVGKYSVDLYQVRLPIFHGYNDADATPQSELPWAGVCLPPSMHGTKFSDGDIVYVSIEDLDSAVPVILGMAPVSQQQGLNGSFQSQSSIGMSRVSNITTLPEASVILPHDLLIRANRDVSSYEKEKYQNSKKTPYVTGTEVSYLLGTVDPIQEQINTTNSYLLESFNNLMNLKISPNTSKIQVDPKSWVSSGEFPGIDVTYDFRYNSSDRVYRQGNRIYNESQLKTIGITFVSPETFGSVASFSVSVESGPVQITGGGTGANTVEGARESLGLKQQLFINSDAWDDADVSQLQPNTIYFIYQE